MSDFFSPGPFGCLPTGHIGEGDFMRPNGLIVGAAARSLPSKLSFNVVEVTPLPLHPRRFGAQSVRTTPGSERRALG
jgi:hypothetical protein